MEAFVLLYYYKIVEVILSWITGSHEMNLESIRANFVLVKVRYNVPNNHHPLKSNFFEEFLKNSFTLR